MAEADINDSNALLAWDATLAPLKVDIVGDFAGKQLFAIHGEAMLSYCVAKAKVDYDDGFQLLHAVHAVEVFLSKLKERGCNFHVLWFDSQRELAVPRDALQKHRSKYLMTRAVLMENLRLPEGEGNMNHDHGWTQSPVSFVFPAITSDEFSKYLEANSVYFIMGSRYGFSMSQERNSQGSSRHLATAFLFARRQYSLAFIDDLEFRSSKVYSSVVTQSNTLSMADISEPASPSTRAEDTIAARFTTNGSETNARAYIAKLFCAGILAKRPDVGTQKRAAAFLLHVGMLEHLELAQRSYGKVIGADDEDQQFLVDFAMIATDLIRRWMGSDASRHVNWRVCDVVDGRLFLHILRNLKSVAVPSNVHQYLDAVSSLVGIDLSEHLADKDDAAFEDLSKIQVSLEPLSVPSVLPFSHPVLNHYLDDLELETDEGHDDQTAGFKVFRELSHWHNAKRAIDPKHRPAQQLKDWRAQRRNQRFMADTIAYSASLTNASGKNIDPEVIVVRGEEVPKKQAAQKPTKNQKGGKAKALEASKALRAAKDEARSLEVSSSLTQRCRNLEMEKSLAKRYHKLVKYLLTLSKADTAVTGGELELYACDLLATMVGEPPFGERELNMIALLRHHAIKMQSLPLTASTRKQLRHLNKALQLPVNSEASNIADMPLSFTSSVHLSAKNVRLPEDTREFQLNHCGPYMERSFDSAPDSRVPFNPDAWQRKVLDAIDADKSLFVVAPTSAGKTFISFYAMKKILQANDDDVLVYVAPTKALVNQIAAEIQARFSKTYSRAGKSVWAIHTRDYRINNPTGCQILVTVPHVLQIMLLAPSNSQTQTSWACRVKRIIFDEVHCIGQADDGVIWEQLLLLAPCPIIALSATVGNPLEFRDWLTGNEQAKGFELEMVVHNARYSDLRKFIYQPPEEEKFTGLGPVERLPIPGLDSEGDESKRFVFVHPVGSLVNVDQGTLADTNLEPRDCLQLWNSMTALSKDQHVVSPELHPKRALPSNIEKSDVIDWEISLKKELYGWIADRTSSFHELRSKFDVQLKPCDYEWKSVFESTIPLIIDLRARGALPAILFNYDRGGCEKMLFGILKTLQDAEQEYRQDSPEWKKKEKAYLQWQKNKVSEKPAKVKKSRGRRDDKDDGTAFDKMDHLREDAGKEDNIWASFDIDAPIEKFSFADSVKISKEELEKLIKSLAWHKIREPFIHALRRGLGVHHAGMNRQYRQVVEMLFRKGFLTVVIATGTLALGLNMPCKTVVFAGDSAFLTALNYRQASGRAGRRGFDLLGNVVFHNVPQHRAKEIMSSRLPDLRGQFPMSTTLVLRLLSLLHGTNNSDYATKAVQSLLTQTRLYLGGPSEQASIKHHLRFSIEYLRRQQLLSAAGAPLNFSGLVGHLYFTENAVFAFHSLLKGGYLHGLCDDIDQGSKQKEILLELLLVLCHLFCRIPCHRHSDEKWLREVVHRSPSLVMLPRLPEEAERCLKSHNNETLDIFKTYISTFVQRHLRDSPDNELPFTKHRIIPQHSEVNLAAASIPASLPTRIRSPFSALSGFTDEFATIHELCETVRAGVFLEESAIPYIPIYPHETNGVPFNAYIFDFFKHGDMDALVRDNGIKSGDVWFHLKDFSLMLATIVTSLANFLGKSGAEYDDMAMIDVQDAGDALDEEAELGEDGDLTHGNSNFEAPELEVKAKAPEVKKGKTTVAESWEDEEGSDDDGDGALGGDGPAESAYTHASGEENEGQSLLKVYKAFRLLQQQFDETFRKVWA
ncbi:putative helicase [Colletotrichum orbiculare MAFF 240422]|uniref:Helicase n=1 Tax=Colletotrichum orbiculare (strain 104-T / ATCC 96160 / CBS 514.97 / LARS 414 / MAFF 240422) TaxID=1213857 RepID=N4VB91_COLOR|nr:putative helicase [Colletotrichum orbiculare MAFF 240422]